MCIHPILVGILIVAGIGLCVISFSIGCSSGEGKANKKILERQQQAETAKRWQDVLQKLNEGRLV